MCTNRNSADGVVGELLIRRVNRVRTDIYRHTFIYAYYNIYVASWARLLGEKNVARQCCEIVKQTATKNLSMTKTQYPLGLHKSS